MFGAISVLVARFHALVWLGGSLYVVMAVHIVYYITAGISYGRLGRELAYSLKAVVRPNYLYECRRI